MSERKLRWMRLDNAAKIYPAAKRRNWSSIFRLSATLNEPIDPLVLQSAVDVVVKRFPSIAVRIRRGTFWYFLEEVANAPKVREDEPYPCSSMNFTDIRKCSFTVFYYKNRIAVEFFHSLTDGNGGLIFLKTLVAEYLLQQHHIDISASHGVLDRQEEPHHYELEDSFLKYQGEVSSSRKETTAYRLRGTKEEDGFLNLITGVLDTDQVLQLAKSHHTTLTGLIVSILIASIIELQNEKVPNRKRQRPVKIMIPVDLRKYYDSQSVRNFALYISPGIDPRMGEYKLEEIIKSVHHQMGLELTEKNLNTKITANVKAEKLLLLRVMPLFIKNLAMKLAFRLVGERKCCLALSNLGVVKLPDEMIPYVERFDFILGAQATRPSNCGMLSYQGKLYISFIRNIIEPDLEHKFFTLLRKLGVHVKIESNQR